VSLRLRLTLFISLLVAAAVVAVSWAAYASARNEARDEIDQFLQGRGGPDWYPGDGVPADWPRGRGTFDPVLGLRREAVVQLIGSDGSILLSLDETIILPISPVDTAVAAREVEQVLRDVHAGGVHYRMITLPALAPLAEDPEVAVQVARDLTETDAFLADLRIRLVLIGAGAVLLTAAASWFVSRRALRPLGSLTEAAEHVAATRELEIPIDVDRKDEIGRLADSFNSMLAALAISRRQQQQLVADAGHELRTPLTSLRTNIEVLARAGDMEPAARAELLEDATHELEELSVLVTELVDLAFDADAAEDASEVDLAEVVTDAVDRFRRRTGREVRTATTESPVVGRPVRLVRATANLLDNAAKWGPPGAPIEVEVAAGRVTVRDHGPGIAAADLPHVFERFYRATAARALPGSGLGLSIVEQVAAEHGGTAFAANHPGGGAVVGFEIPGT